MAIVVNTDGEIVAASTYSAEIDALFTDAEANAVIVTTKAEAADQARKAKHRVAKWMRHKWHENGSERNGVMWHLLLGATEHTEPGKCGHLKEGITCVQAQWVIDQVSAMRPRDRAYIISRTGYDLAKLKAELLDKWNHNRQQSPQQR